MISCRFRKRGSITNCGDNFLKLRGRKVVEKFIIKVIMCYYSKFINFEKISEFENEKKKKEWTLIRIFSS